MHSSCMHTVPIDARRSTASIYVRAVLYIAHPQPARVRASIATAIQLLSCRCVCVCVLRKSDPDWWPLFFWPISTRAACRGVSQLRTASEACCRHAWLNSFPILPFFRFSPDRMRRPPIHPHARTRSHARTYHAARRQTCRGRVVLSGAR